MAKVYELPLTRTYVAAWGMKEAVRELIQNALDSESPFEYHWNSEMATLRITSKFANLDKSSLLLGMTSKAGNDNQIGAFGEGYKLAMLVLTRMNHKVVIYNDGVVWLPHFAHSKQFEHETLHVTERKPERGEPREGLTFEVHDIFGDDMAQIRLTCLQMQNADAIGKSIQTPFGQIMESQAGNIYVGGLFITRQDNMRYGYNFNPDQVTLERDRQTLNSYDLFMVIKNLWFSVAENHMDTIVDMIEAQNVDMYYARYSMPELVKEAVYAAFVKKHGDSIPVGSQQELKELAARGITNYVYVNDSHNAILHSVEAIAKANELALHRPTPLQELQEFFGSMDCKFLTQHDRDLWEALLVKAEDWKI